MSITSPDARVSSYDPVAPTTEFAAGFTIWDNDDLAVFHNGVRRTDFTVSASYGGSGFSTNAKAVFAEGLTGRVTVVGLRSPRRNSRFTSGGPLPIENFNLALDTLAAQAQEASRDIGRALKVGHDDDPQDLPLPEVAKVLGWLDGKLSNIDAGEFISPLNSASPITMLGGVVYRSLVDKLREIGVSPRDAVRTAGTGEDDADAIQEVLDYGNEHGIPVYLDGTWLTSRALTIGAGPQPFDIRGRAFIQGIASTPQAGILIFEGERVTLSGYIKVDGQRSANHPVGWWVKGGPSFQYVDLRGLSVDRCETAFRIGDKSNPDAVISEIVVNGGSTYSCPRVGLIEGTETYVTIAGGMKPADAFGGDSAWNSKVKRGLTILGARVKVVGGELIQAVSASPNDFLIDLQPLKKADGSLDWGECELNNVYIETAGPLAMIRNPSALAGSIANKGLFRVENCSGYHSQNNADFITVAAGAGFTGKIVEGGNNFRCPTPRTFQNINCNDNQCDVYPSLEGLGQNFKPWFSGITGGFKHGTPEDAGTGNYVPAISAGAGAITSASATASFRKIGGIVYVSMSISIANNGTGAGFVIASLPIAPRLGVTFNMLGRANSISGKMLQGFISGTQSVAIRNFDGSYPGASGETLEVSGWYEAA